MIVSFYYVIRIFLRLAIRIPRITGLGCGLKRATPIGIRNIC